MEKVFLSRLEPDLAAQLLRGMDHLDASGRTGPGDVERMTAEGQCFAATLDKAQAVYVVSVKNGIAWISAARGFGLVDWSALLLPTIEAQSQGCAAVAFQTARPGLVRKAKKQGYAVTGWILKKALP